MNFPCEVPEGYTKFKVKWADDEFKIKGENVGINLNSVISFLIYVKKIIV